MNILKLEDLKNDEIEKLVDTAIDLKNGKRKISCNDNKVIANLFLSHPQELIIVLKWLNIS